MILGNLCHRDFKEPVDVIIHEQEIAKVVPAGKANEQPQIYFDNAIVFPGLINSHDHLDFNLFPNLGNRTYGNYREWAGFIHQHYQKEINEVLSIPKYLRTQCGIYKNLLCGVTTVVNHGDPLMVGDAPINVVQPVNNLHSVGFEKQWKLKLNHPLRRKHPYVIHIGEGVDAVAYREINQLLNWNLLNKKLIGVHGLSMTAQQASSFSALVWCPVSNQYMFNATANIHELKHHTPILFGTDSTLTAHWNIWEHLKAARATAQLQDEELFDALTIIAAKIWKLNCGNIAASSVADLVVAHRKTAGSFYSNFYALEPEDILLVICKGQIRLFDESLLDQLNQFILPEDFSAININSKVKYVVGNLPALLNQVASYHQNVSFPVTAAQPLYHDQSC
jgi:cytosine/adenosine deaminase-related metal-dependent hydrolase